ncbi:hypothetical protein NC652_035563 [Populus alba x Populus x berolinensis]|nr:hypothetical protein NC652_035563 [Populus alba x Populus x berolinensis]
MFLKKLSYLAKHLRLWNCEHFGNQESWLLNVTNRIVENKRAESILTAEESSVWLLASDIHVIISLH